MPLSGLNKNVLPQFAGPKIKCFLNLPRPLPKSNFTASEKLLTSMPLFCKVPIAQLYSGALHPTT